MSVVLAMAGLLAVLVLAFSAHQEPSAVETPAPVDAVEARGQLRGVLKHSVTKAALAQVPVVLRASDGEERHATTNDHGLYVFHDLPADSYTLEVRVGDASVAKIFQLEHEATRRIDLQIDSANEFRRVIRVSAAVGTSSERRMQRRHARHQARQRRGCARYYRAWARVYRQKARQDEAAARKRARRDR